MDNQKSGKRKNRWILVIAILLAMLLLYFSLKGISWNEVWRTIVGANWALILAGVGLTWINLGVRAIRWGVLLSAEKKISPITMFWATSVGYLGNLTLPARAGEVIRSAALSRKTNLSLAYIFATALTERVLDVLILVIIALAASTTISDLPGWMGQTLPLMAGLGVAAVIFLIAAPRFEKFFGQIIQRLPIPPNWREGIAKFINRFLMGGKAFLHPGRAGSFLGLSGIIWLVDGVIAILVARALGLTLSLAKAMLFLVGLGLSSAIPSTPGYVGVYQFVAVTLLPLFGIEKNQALSFMLVLQATSVVVVVVSGLIGAWRLGIRKLQSSEIGGVDK